jgi:2-polyprenyl-3-methyl-5-hydroxy-6-metoxy-1,4-benzoquinol methylase
MHEVRKGTISRSVLRTLLQFIRHLATRVSAFGERHGIEWLVYNPILFLYFFGRSYADAPGVVRTIESVFPDAHRCLDVGAGSGCFAARMGYNHDVVACEYNSLGRLITRLQGIVSHPFDLAKPFPSPAVEGQFDLVYCFEVAEHLPEHLGVNLVTFIASHGDVVLFSAAIPGQGGMGHINEQPPSYWVQRFTSIGMVFDESSTNLVRDAFAAENVAAWFSTNAIVMRRS